MDGPLSKHMESSAPQPTQASLDRMLERVAKVRVFAGGMNWDRPMEAEVLAEVDDAAIIQELKQALRIVDGPAGHCMCDGDPTLELLGADGKRVAALGLHHGIGIRWSEWKDDAQLVEGMDLLLWLAGSGVSGPLDEFMDDVEMRAGAEAAWNLWVGAMPECLKSLPEAAWRKVLQKGDLFPLLAALARAFPDAKQRALALLEWHGHSGDAWSGFPTYEGLPEAILAQYPEGELAKIIEAAQLGDRQLAGAARFFACYDTKRGGVLLPSSLGPTGEVVSVPARAGGMVPLSAALRARLLEAALKSTDADGRKRAEAAFLPPES